MKTYFLILLFLISLTLSCQQKNKSESQYQISKLEQAESDQNLKTIRDLFLKDAVVLLPDFPPVVGNEAIASLFQFSWQKQNNKKQKYLVDSVSNCRHSYLEYGRLISVKKDQSVDTVLFRATYEQIHGNYFLTELNFGNTQADKMIPKLPKPTGPFGIGQLTYYFDKDQNLNQRQLSFQVWYPAIKDTGGRVAYRSASAVQAAAKFLGWPLFANSFVTSIKSHALKNATVAKGSFPVVIYNHGYGGFSGVYQTVFEELASSGYVVVSIGHQDESALLQIDEENVIGNSRENKIFAQRASELNGTKISELQSVILNSDKEKEVKLAYEDLLSKSPLHNKSVELWEQDTREVLDKLSEINRSDERIQGAMDLNTLGVFGHSVGGAAAGELSYSCPQVKAGINLDGFQFGNLNKNRLQSPFLFVSSNASGNTYLRVSPFSSESMYPCHHIVLKGYSHDMFSDLPLIMQGNKRAVLLQRALVKSFFDKYLKKKDLDLELLSGEFEEIQIVL